jgi:hypothetical protein
MTKNVADVRTGLASAHREGAQSFIYNHGSHQKSISVVSVWPWPERPSPRRSRTGRSTHSDRSHRGLPEAFRRSTLSGYLSPVATIRQRRGRRTQFRGSPMRRGSGSPREVVPIRVATRSKVRTRRRSRSSPRSRTHTRTHRGLTEFIPRASNRSRISDSTAASVGASNVAVISLHSASRYLLRSRWAACWTAASVMDTNTPRKTQPERRVRQPCPTRWLEPRGTSGLWESLPAGSTRASDFALWHVAITNGPKGLE